MIREKADVIKKLIGVLCIVISVYTTTPFLIVIDSWFTEKEEHTKYYAIDTNEYRAVLSINDDEISIFTTQEMAFFQGYYAEGKNIYKYFIISDEYKALEKDYYIMIKSSGNKKQLYLDYYMKESNDEKFYHEECYNSISKEEYESLFIKVSDSLYERYDEISDSI